jgi:hypothetical protein
MKRTVIKYTEYGRWVYIHKIKNAATCFGLKLYFRLNGCEEHAWKIYVRGKNLREDSGMDVAYYYDDIEDKLVIEYIANSGLEDYQCFQKNRIVKKEVFDKIIQDLQIAGERLEKIVAKYQKETKEVTI